MDSITNKLSHINMLAADDAIQFVHTSEHRYNEALSNIVETISKNQDIEIVLLAGPSSSGKTTTANKISKKLSQAGHKAYTISLDDFYRNAAQAIVGENGKPDYESVNSLELELLSTVLNNLVEQRKSFIPKYNFDLGIRTDRAFEIELKPGDVVILEGLHALNPVIYSALPAGALYKIYISVSTRVLDNAGDVLISKRDLRLIRRTVRDYQFRNSSVENTFNMWDDVLYGEEKYLAPYKYCADVLIDSFHSYEPCVFKNEALTLFKTVSSDSFWYPETKRLSDKLQQFNAISKENVPYNSLLREFLGNKN